MIISLGGNSELNYKIVGSAIQPTSPSENTIWIDPTLDREALSTVSTTLLSSYYIHADTGVVTSASTSRTRYFACIEGHQYRFRLTSGQTVVIASFTKQPASGVTGTPHYGVGKNQGEEILDYTLTAPVGSKYLGIYFYNSGTNTSVPTLTINDLTYQATFPEVVEITNHVFSFTQPEAPAVGTVWFKTGNSGDISLKLFKKDECLVYLNSCQQYVNGVWVEKTTLIYQNGEWKVVAGVSFYLFNGTTDVTDVSGSWSKWSGASGGTITISSGVMKMKAPAAEAARSNATFGHSKTVDLTTHKTITVTTNSIPTKSEDRSYVAVYDSSKNKLASATLTKSTTTTTLDVSGISGECYIGFYVVSYYSVTSYTWESITIEVKQILVS